MESTETTTAQMNVNDSGEVKNEVEGAEKPKKSVRFCTPQQALIFDNV